MHAAVLEPVDQGESFDPEAARGRKLRPIGLSEALIKFAENAKLDEGMQAQRAVLEPAQLGAGTPDGVAIAIWVLRVWAKDIEMHARSEDVISGTDLDNPFCGICTILMSRSQFIFCRDIENCCF